VSTAPTHRTQSEDTTYEVEQRISEHWRSLAPAEKAALVGEASAALGELSLAGVKQRLPDACRRELELRLLARLYGRDIVRTLLGIDVPEESVRFA